MDDSALKITKRSVTIAGHRTSLSLEQQFWDILQDIAQKNKMPLAKLIADIDQKRRGNLSSALRLYVLDHLTKR